MAVSGKQLTLAGELKRKRVLAAVLLFVAIAPHIYAVVQLKGSAAGIDDGFQVLAARNQFETGVPGIFESGGDIARPAEVRRLTNWPPTYRNVLVTLRRAGMSWSTAIISVRILLILLAAAAWYALGLRVLKSPVWAATLLIPILYRVSTHPADMVVGLISPVVMLVLLANAREAKLQARHAVVLTLGVTVMVAFKYSALFFIPGTFLTMTWQSWRRRSLLRDFVPNGAVVLPALVVFVAIFYSNDVPDIVSDATPFRTEAVETPSSPSLTRVLTLPITTFFGKTFKSDSAARIVHKVLVKTTRFPWQSIWYTLTALLWLGFLVPLIVYFRTLKSDEPMRELIVVCMILGLSAAAFLIAVDLSLSKSGYTRVHRYYAPVAAALIIIYIRMVVDFLTSRFQRLRLLAIFVFLLIGPSLLVHVSRRAASLIATENPRYAEGMAFIRETTDALRGQDHAAYFGQIGAFCLLDRPIQHFRVPTDRFADGIVASEPTWLFIVHNPNLTSDLYTDFADTMRVKYDMQVRQQNGWQVIYKKVGPGTGG